MLRKYWNNTILRGKVQAFVLYFITSSFLLIFNTLYLNKKTIGFQPKE